MNLETPKPVIRPRGYQDPFEPWGAKLLRKFNENPLVPIGCILTCGALIMSAHKLRQGNSKQMNHWLRARVALQGVTIVALVVGSMQLQKSREENHAQAEAAAQAVAEREKQEFEKRLKEAERTSLESVKVGATAETGKVSALSSSWWWPSSRRKD